MANWNEDKKQFDENFARSMVEYHEKYAEWSKDKEKFLKEQSQKNSEVDHFIQCYNNGETDAVTEYYSLLLESIKLPFEYDRQVELELNSENKMLLIDLLLPTVNDIPKLKKKLLILNQKK